MTVFAYQLGAHEDGLARAMELREPGRCLFCEGLVEQFPGAKERAICDEPDCRKAYQAAYHRDYRRNTLASEWAISIRGAVRAVAVLPCVFVTVAKQETALCGKCATCSARKHLAGLETAK